MAANVVITGVGIVTPLGHYAEEVLKRISLNETAACKPDFETDKFDCAVCAPVREFDAEEYFPENKTLRLMNRDAQMAVVAARFAMEDAAIRPGEIYPPEDIALFGSTGMACMSVEDISRVIRYAANDNGSLSLERFGSIALKRLRPILSFRILANMPICFVSIFENTRGPNAVYTPWEGQGAQAIAAGIHAIRRGDVPCALVGGCDSKCRELSFVSLQQLGIFESWRQNGSGSIPGEGAAFLVLEDEIAAAKRGKQTYALLKDHVIRSTSGNSQLEDIAYSILSQLKRPDAASIIVGAGEANSAVETSETRALERAHLECRDFLKPKSNIGSLFAAAAPVQVGLAAQLARQQEKGQTVIANCFGYGAEKASFVLEAM